jgi:hypothetical protein
MVKHKHYNEIIAWANGEEIEAYSVPANTWFQTSNPTWSKDVQYRVKPKQELIPFDFSDAEKLIGKVVRHKEGLNCVAVLVECNLQHICIGNDFERYEVLLQDYTFLDGSPCGKLKE